MQKTLFSVRCTTCQAALGVRNAALIGQLIDCPKCGSFVQIVPPEGWVAPADGGESGAKSAATPVKPAPPAAESKPAAATAPAQPQGQPKPAGKPVSAPPAKPDVAPVAKSDGGAPPVSPEALAARASAVPAPPVPPVVGRTAAVAAAAVPLSAVAAPATAPATMPPATAPVAEAVAVEIAAAAEGVSLWTKAAVVLSATAVVLLAAVLVRQFWPRTEKAPVNVQEPVEVVHETPPKEKPPQAAQKPATIDLRWVPNDAKLLFRAQGAVLGDSSGSRYFEQFGAPWQKKLAAVMRSMSLKPESLERATLVSTDLSAWPEKSVLVLELAKAEDAAPLAGACRSAGFSLQGVECQRLTAGDWAYPLAVVEGKTIVTGDEELLRQLSDRKEAAIASQPMSRLLKAVAPDADATILIDLSAARQAQWKLPEGLFDVWPAGRAAWRTIWELAEGLGCMVRCTSQAGAEIALVCDGDSAAEKVYQAINDLTPAAKKALAAGLEAVAGKVEEGKLDAATAAQYTLLLKQMTASLDAMRCEVNHGVVWCRAGGSADAAALLAAGLRSQKAVASDWFEAAKTADEAAMSKLLEALAAYQKSNGKFPPGAVDGALLDPETRLSWIALLLPHLGHADWYNKLERGYSWNAPQNQPTTRRPLPEAVNPALGPSATEAGFPVTHYVGVAGVGPDAGKLPANDPRAGVFGYARTMRPEEIADGASNTIAVLGVNAKTGAWAAGGNATVRPLTKAPYVNGPDGFGSGQPDGMLAGMADGSVRFISKDIDPQVLEQLATASGHEKASAALLEPAPRKAAPERKPAEAKNPSKPETPEKKPAPADSPELAAAAAALKERLNMPVAAIGFKETPLRKAVATLCALGGIAATYDPDALADLGVALSDPVSVKLEATTLGKALQATVERRGLTCAIEGGGVLISSPPAFRQTLGPWRQSVLDLTGGKQAEAVELAGAIERLIVPESWKRSGGRGTIAVSSDMLSGQQTSAVVRRVAEFLDKLRVARGLTPKTLKNLDASDLKTRAIASVEALGRPITLNYHEGAPLAEVVTAIEEAGEATILIDWSAAAAAKVTPQTKASLAVERQPLGAVLDALCEPLSLTWLAVNGETFAITTPKSAAVRLELEFYPLTRLLATGKRSAQALVEQIQSEAAPASWSDAGGPGAIWLDKASACVVVLQTQKVHAEIARVLREKQ